MRSAATALACQGPSACSRSSPPPTDPSYDTTARRDLGAFQANALRACPTEHRIRTATTSVPTSDQIDQHLEVLHAYHLDLWTEIEGQLRVLRAAQEKLRAARIKGEPKAVGVFAAQMLTRHVNTLKGRVHTLGSTIDELEHSVEGLTDLLGGAGVQP